jgi:hypothetical protein
MQEPDHAQGIIRLESLIEDDLHLRIDPTNRATVIGWGLFFTVAHQVRALLELHRVGACAVAAPNRRTAVEYMITLRWSLDQGDRIGGIFNRKLRGDQIQLAKSLRDEENTGLYTKEAYEFMVQTVKTVSDTIPPDPNERLAKIEHLLAGYNLKTWKSLYQLESRFVHATPTGVQMFFRDGGDEDAIYLSQMPLREEVVPCIEFAFMVLFYAMLTFNGLLIGAPWDEELRQLSVEYGLPATLPTWQGTSSMQPAD